MDVNLNCCRRWEDEESLSYADLMPASQFFYSPGYFCEGMEMFCQWCGSVQGRIVFLCRVTLHVLKL